MISSKCLRFKKTEAHYKNRKHVDRIDIQTIFKLLLLEILKALYNFILIYTI